MNPTGYQLKGDKRTIDDVFYTFDKDSGERQSLNSISVLSANGQYTTNRVQNWYYQVDGENVKGLYTNIDGQLRYFDLTTGVQTKGDFVTIGNDIYYFTKEQGDW